MKKALTLLLCSSLLLSSVACGNSETAESTSSTDVSTVSEATSGESDVSNGTSLDSTSSEDGSTEVVDPDSIITNTAFPENYVEPEPVEYKSGNDTLVKQLPSNISLYKYCGHWQADEGDLKTYVSHWNTAYVEVDFTGKVIYVDFSKPSKIKVSIDGGDFVKYDNASGNMKFEAASDGKHTLQIRNIGTFQDHVYFAGASVPKGQTLSRTADKEHYIQFIGDSISQDGRSHAHNSADMLGWDYSVVAKGAMSLRSGSGYWGDGNPKMLSVLGKSVGMEDAFFKLGHPEDSMSETDKIRYRNYFNDDTLNFNFQTGKTPDVVFIFLGTNDRLIDSSAREDFVKRYSDFVDNILKAYGNKPHIFIMQALSAKYEERYISINLAGTSIAEKHPNKVTFIDRNTVDSWGVEIGSDGTHPSAAGYATLAEQVAIYLNKNVK